jgi:hypothetical protein
MRRFFTLVCLLCLAIPAGISISGCTRNPGANYCNGLGYGLKDTDVASIDLEPRTTGISLAFGQTQQMSSPTAKTCKGTAASPGAYTYGTTNNQLVDISPSGNLCAGTWNRNSGGGIADFTTCRAPNPLPATNGLPFGAAYITASAISVTSNPVEVYVHAQVSSITLVGPQKCLSQGQLAQLDAQACYSSNGKQYLMCAPSGVTNYACPLPPTVTSVPACTSAIGTLSYMVGSPAIAAINNETNQITAAQPGTTVITASVAGSGSSAGYFTTCPPQSISVTVNGATSATVTKGVQQNLTTTVIDTNGTAISGLALDYQSTDPVDISAGSTGGILANFPGQASVFAVCQPPTCNTSPINVVGLYGTGLPVSSNPVNITTPGTASDYVWYSAPGQSQYFVPVELLSGTVGSTVRMPYVPNSMVMDRLGNSLYFGSSHGVMIYGAASNSLVKTDTSVPGVVLAVSPDNSTVLINDQVRQLFYIYAVSGNSTIPYGGLGTAAAWTPDAKTLYITGTDSITGKPTLFVYSQASGWTENDLSATGAAQNLAITVPGVGAYLSGATTVAHTWCPTGTVTPTGSTISSFYPLADSVSAKTDVLAATTDGQHILGAAMIGGGITLSDIGVTIPNGQCPPAISNVLQPLTIAHTLNQAPLANVSATAVNQVVTSPASNLAFVTYTGATPGAVLPYYQPVAGGKAGTVNSVTLMNGSTPSTTVTAPVAGAFSPDNTTFFVSTTGDNQIHYIDVPTLTDKQQISPNLPACNPATDSGCTLAAPSANPVAATAIAVKPRATT